MQRVITGEAVFLEEMEGLWDLRQSTKSALQDNVHSKRFVVKAEEDYYTDRSLEQLLLIPEECKAYALELGDQIVGEENGAWRCAAIWSLESGMGVLMHREGTALYYAYLPIVAKEAAVREHTLSLALSRLAKEAGDDAMIRLESSISAGEYRLCELLETLSEEIEV